MKSELQKVVVHEDVTIAETIKRLRKSKYNFAVVVDQNDRFRGMVTDGLLLQAQIEKADLMRPVQQLMSKGIQVARMYTSPQQLMKTLIANNLPFIPLVDGQGRVKDIAFLSELSNNLRPMVQNASDKVEKVLVIGGAGYIGSVLTRKLLKKNYRIRVLDNLLYGVDSLKDLYGNPRLTFIKGDVRNVQDLIRAVDDVDVVVHLAAIVGDPACTLDHSTTIEVNYEATKLLAEVCKHHNVQRLIFSSNCSVYGSTDSDELLHENSPLNPVSLYSETKLKSEMALLENNNPESLAVTILRLATVFGLSPRPRFDLVVNVLTAKAVVEKKICIFGGDQWRPYVHVDDVANAFLACLECPIEVIRGEIFNVGSESQNYRIEEIGRIIRRLISGVEVEVIESKVDKRNYRVTFAKIERVLGYRARRTLHYGIREIRKAIEDGIIRDYKDKRYNNYEHLQ